MTEHQLQERIHEIGRETSLRALAVATHDYESGQSFEIDSDRWFHAASVIKVAILLGLLKNADDNALHLDDPLHVRNRFVSVADGSIFRIDRDRDGDAECHRRIGRTMHLSELARAMIVRSSNLATNLLLDLLGVANIRRVLAEAKISGVRIVRGVEDETAFKRGIINEMTPTGARQLFRVVCEGGFLREDTRSLMREMLLAQEFNSMIPARLPNGVKVAHKTGEISTHSHDAGIVYPPDRKPYVVSIFTESDPGVDYRTKAVAMISAEIHSFLTT
jgi:beta-lactamase class A